MKFPSNMKKFLIVASFGICATVIAFPGYAQTTPSNTPPVTRPTHGPGSSGPPTGTYRNDQFQADRINSIGLLDGPMWDHQIRDWNTMIGSSLSNYRILLSATSRAARVGIQNCDKPYFDAAMNNMRVVMSRLQDVRDHIQRMHAGITESTAQAQRQIEQTIQEQGPPGLPGVGTAVGEVVDLVPGVNVVGKVVNAAGDESDRQAQTSLWEGLQKKNRLQAWAPQMNTYLQQTNALLTMAQQDASALTAAFNPEVCHVCGDPSKAETPVAQVVMPPASTLPAPPRPDAVNRVVEDFIKTAHHAAEAAKQQPSPPSNRPQFSPGIDPGNY
jgi:hypothetical protein